jgi:hypothetical protein
MQLLQEYMQHIVVALQAIEQFIYITSSDEKDKVRRDITTLFNNSMPTSSASSPSKQRGLQPRNIFFGPLIVDLEPKDLTPLNANSMPDISTNTNIQLNYLVTDKADGERYLLFINSRGVAYLIGRGEHRPYSNPIKLTGITLPLVSNSIYDGEFISKLTTVPTAQFVQHFYVFDAYIYCGNNIMTKGFLWNKDNGRHSAIRKLIEYIKSNESTTASDIKQLNPALPFRIFAKEYLPSDSITSYINTDTTEAPLIFKNCARLLHKMNTKYGGTLDGTTHLYNYATDGLVFLPNNFGIFQMSKGDAISELAADRRWLANYKWKPADHLTLDFKAIIAKSTVAGQQYNYVYRNSRRYVQVNLYCKYYGASSSGSGSSRLSDIAGILAYTINHGYNLDELPEDYPFTPCNPFIGEVDSATGIINNYASSTLLEIDSSQLIHCTNGDILINGDTAEFTYDMSIDADMRWIPIKCRSGKVPNAVLTATTTWNQIHAPITTSLLCSGYLLAAAAAAQHHDGDASSSSAVEATLEYYNTSKFTRKSEPLTKFDNYVKKLVIQHALSTWSRPKVLDLANGMMGDYYKFFSAGASTLIGMDIAADNIHNKIKGSAVRLADYMTKGPQHAKLISNTLIIQGDMSKNIATGDAAADELNRYYLNVLYDRAVPNSPKLARLHNIGLDGFHVISCMYAIHYMFADELTLRSFLTNVSDNLRIGGLFIGVCVDGPTIMNSFSGDSTIVKMLVGDTVIFSIEKYEGVEYKELTTGQPINVFFETFARPTKEYLVNINYLAKIAEEYELELIASELYTSSARAAHPISHNKAARLPPPPISKGKVEILETSPRLMLTKLLEQYGMDESPENMKEIIATPAFKQWADYQRYFIFKKTTTTV